MKARKLDQLFSWGEVGYKSHKCLSNSRGSSLYKAPNYTDTVE